MSASAMREISLQRPQRAANQSRFAPKFEEHASAVSSAGVIALHSRYGGGCAHLP